MSYILQKEKDLIESGDIKEALQKIKNYLSEIKLQLSAEV